MLKTFRRNIIIILLLASTLLCIQAVFSAQEGECAPLLLYSSAKAGPNSGWENSATKGAAITVWARDIGSTRGSNFVTVGGMNLTSDADYAEWGATTNPRTAKGLQRITFWLNSNMSVGNSTGITVTVNGVQSNALPFTINSSSSHRIIFVDPVNGLETNNGLYSTQGSGSNGPWRYPFSSATRPSVTPGTFIYLRGGTYTNIMATGWHAPREGIIGVAEVSSGGCNWYYSPTHGTDSLRITMTSYPGEHARFFNASFSSYSSYWTFANFTMDGDLTYAPNNIYFAIVLGMQEGYCSSCNYKITSNQLIGLSLIGYIHIGVQAWGNNHNIFANYIYNYPTAQGLGADHSYNLYIGSSDSVTMRDNELHGGSRYNVQVYDETRNCTPLYSDAGRGISNVSFDSNLVDMNRSAVAPLDKWYGIIAGMAWSGGFLNNTTIKNNVFYLNDGSLNIYHAAINIYQESAPATLNGFYIYNNTIYGTQYGIYTMQANNTTVSNVDIKNNILSNINSNQWYSESSGRITPTWSYNLTDKALSFSGAVTNNGNNVLGSPGFVSPSGSDFHIPSSSPAVGVGLNLAPILTRDFEWKNRSASSGWAIGAYEYGSAAGGAPKVPLAPYGLIVR